MQFNEKSQSRAEKTRSTNHEDGESFDPASPELALTKVVINNLLEDTFYETAEEQLNSVKTEFDAAADANPEFVLKLAKYARQEENLRQIPQALLVLAANDERTQPFVRDYARSIMSRADEPLEVLAFHVSTNGKTIPNCLQNAIEDAMHEYNEYQYAKWDRDSREFQYRDLLNLVHPKPRDDERKAIFSKVAKGGLDDYPEIEELKQTDTWESSLSDDSDDRSKQEKYEEQLSEGNMGLFPRIRQARDMLETGVAADDIYDGVTDEWVRNSRLYPFRFYQAYKAVRGEGIAESFGNTFGRGVSNETPDIPQGERQKALEYLEGFMDVATENLPDVLEDTFVAVDTSGSMGSNISEDSDLQCVEIGALFGSMLYRRGADLGVVASDFKSVNGDRRNTTVSIAETITGVDAGGATNGYLVPHGLREEGLDSYNQIIIFTDMQLWDSNGGMFGRDTSSFRDEWNQYKQFNPDASLYLVDLQNHGDLVTPEGAQDVYNISGWTENVIDFIDSMENVDGMVNTIEETEPDQ